MAALTGEPSVPRLDEEGRAALALTAIDGLGPGAILRLVRAHGSARGVLAAAGGDSLDPDLSPRLRALAARAYRRSRHHVPPDPPDGCRVISFTSREYPRALRRLARPPAVLWAAGPLPPDEPRTVTVVGTRSSTEYGRRMARRLGSELAEAGWRVASGIARGIDAEAHRGALEAGGATVGVPGCGLRRVYPASNRALYRALEDRGLLLTEFPPDEGPRPEHFPRRNRILAGLARAVVVVQADLRSGALITVDRAQEIGVEVLAVPGPVDLPVSRGVHELLREGAGVATSAADVLSMLGEAPGAYSGSPRAALPGAWIEHDPALASDAAGTSSVDRGLAEVLRTGPAHVNALSEAVRLPIQTTLSALGRMEIEGRVRSLPGGRYEWVR